MQLRTGLCMVRRTSLHGEEESEFVVANNTNQLWLASEKGELEEYWVTQNNKNGESD